MKVKISIIIPVYNVANYITECLNSIINQTSTDGVECIIIDDMSTDNSLSCVEGILSEYAGDIQFKIIKRHVNGGISACRNTGIKVASGQYLLFIDSDDYISEDCIERFKSFLTRYKDPDLVVADFETIPYCNKYDNLSFRDKQVCEYYDGPNVGDIVLYKTPIMVWNKLIKTKIVTQNELFFDENLQKSEDDHWRILITPFISTIGFIHTPTYFYRIRLNSLSNKQSSQNRKLALSIAYKDIICNGSLFNRIFNNNHNSHKYRIRYTLTGGVNR